MSLLSGLGELKFLVAATIFHVVALPGAAAMAPEPHRISLGIQSAPPGEIAIDLDSALLPPRPDQRSVDRFPQPADPNAVAYADPHEPRAPNPFAPDQPAPSETASPDDQRAPYDPGEVVTAPEGAEGVNDEYARPPTMGEMSAMPGVPGIPGMPGDGSWTWTPGALPPVAPIDGSAAPTQTPRRTYDKDAATRVVQDGIRAKESKLGLDFPGRGPIRSAFVSAVYSGGVPYLSSANFALSVSPGGKVTAVSLLGFSGGSASDWRRVKQSAHAQLKSTKLVMKSAFSKGANVSVSVKSSKKTPGGGTKREGATFSFDVTDIGAKETRVVTAFVNPQPVR